MKDLKEFVEKLVKIEFIDHCNAFGFYPFQMWIEHKDDKSTFASLDLGGDIRAVYKAFAEYYKEDSKRIYLAVDFPSVGDIESDFVCIIAAEKDIFTINALPYSPNTGEQFTAITKSITLDKILTDLGHFLK